ncbi:MAG: hypothetical protein KAG28_10735 [Cocleimonas sp.]|nr:hypothetical protein [Cocleimonas sp.]
METERNNRKLNIISFITALMLIIAININMDLSQLFYILGGTLSDSNTQGWFNTFFISSLGITSAFIAITYVLIAKCETSLTKILLIISDIFLVLLVFSVTQERAFHNFSSDTHISDANSIVLGTSDTSLLMIILIHIVMMLFSIINAHKSDHFDEHDKASAYD